MAAFADGAERFPNRKHFTSCFGMTPMVDSSGPVQPYGHTNKREPSAVRCVGWWAKRLFG